MTDKIAEAKHGLLATNPTFDLHLRVDDNGNLGVLLWKDGRRYSGTLKLDDDPAPTKVCDQEAEAFTPPTGSRWVDRHKDVWTMGDDGLMHAHETAPFPPAYVLRKWGPLTPARDLTTEARS